MEEIMNEFEDEYFDYQSEYEAELIENALKDISSENIQFYYGTYGDSIEERVKTLIKDSEKLLLQNFYGPSLAVSAICIEVIIRFFLIRPLVQSAFLSDEWADLLTNKITSGNSYENRDILPSILKQWNIDINKFLLSNKNQLWTTIKGKENWSVIKRRNHFMHNGEIISKDEAELALECTEKMLQIVYQISEKFGFTLDVTGKWCEIKNKSEPPYSQNYKPFDAFC